MSSSAPTTSPRRDAEIQRVPCGRFEEFALDLVGVRYALLENVFTLAKDEVVRDFRAPVAEDVLLKARAAALWCAHASEHAAQHGTKPWTYLLIPRDAIEDQRTFSGLAGAHAMSL